MSYTDKTLMPFGKFKGTPLEEVPASYLIWWYESPSDYKKNEDLMEYIKENWDGLQKELKK
jgi:uncharacterized protein (DUF3820 family)